MHVAYCTYIIEYLTALGLKQRRSKLFTTKDKCNHAVMNEIEDITWWREDMNFMFDWQE